MDGGGTGFKNHKSHMVEGRDAHLLVGWQITLRNLRAIGYVDFVYCFDVDDDVVKDGVVFAWVVGWVGVGGCGVRRAGRGVLVFRRVGGGVPLELLHYGDQ